MKEIVKLMADEELLYIEDANKRRLYYRFTPAALVSNFVPLVVILHDEDGAGAHHFEHKMWNVLTPIVDLDDNNRGLCWLGKEDDFYVKELLQELIHQTCEEYECEDHVYLYGKDAGGYGAILHGVLCQANAVYASSPQIRLAQINAYESDLSNLLSSKETFPIFYLCGSSANDETAYFFDACKKHDVKLRLDQCSSSEDEVQALKEVLNFFEKMASEA